MNSSSRNSQIFAAPNALNRQQRGYQKSDPGEDRVLLRWLPWSVYGHVNSSFASLKYQQINVTPVPCI